MPMYVYSTSGEAVGFLFESFVFDLSGGPLGRLYGSRVHRLDGSYAGEWFHQMVVDRRERPARPILAVAAPLGRPAVSPPEPRRWVAEYSTYPDAFHRLYAPAESGEEAWAEAAE